MAEYRLSNEVSLPEKPGSEEKQRDSFMMLWLNDFIIEKEQDTK